MPVVVVKHLMGYTNTNAV